MHSATRLDDLKILECFLQNSLHAHLGRIIPFRVQCLYKDDTLWVLAQHPQDAAIDSSDTFRVLERALQAEEPKIPLAVKLYLRSEGNQRPYSQQGFTVYPLVKKTVPGEAAPAMTGTIDDRIALERDRRLANGTPVEISTKHMENSDFTPSTVPEIVPNDNEIAGMVARQSAGANYSSDRLVTIDADAFASNIENSFGTADENYHSTYPAATNRRNKYLLPILGGLGALAVGTGAGYMGTRPCVLSTCTELTTASTTIQSVLETIKKPQVTGQEALVAQKQLHQSVDALESIPMWSGSYGAAQNTLKTTLPLTQDLDTTVLAMNQAYKATTLVKTPPLPLLKWQQSKQIWTESIANLGTIPTTSQVYPLATQKRTDYQGRLVDIDKRIEIETTADQKLKSATDGIKAATQAQATAKSLAEWRSVKGQWDNASNQLGAIPEIGRAHV